MSTNYCIKTVSKDGAVRYGRILYTLAEAKKICKLMNAEGAWPQHTHIPWPEEHIDSNYQA